MSGPPGSRVLSKTLCSAAGWLAVLTIIVAVVAADHAIAEPPAETATSPARAPVKGAPSDVSWQLPGRVSIYNLKFGPATVKDNEWKFRSDSRTFNAAEFKDRLTLMIRFSYYGSRTEIPLKFVIRLPDSRPYEETVSLMNRQGTYSYHFTIHDPENFLGSGSVYLYYGFSIIDVLDFTIVSGS